MLENLKLWSEYMHIFWDSITITLSSLYSSEHDTQYYDIDASIYIAIYIKIVPHKFVEICILSLLDLLYLRWVFLISFYEAVHADHPKSSLLLALKRDTTLAVNYSANLML